MFRRALLEVSLDALRYNFNLAKSFLLENQRMIAVVKANAYGLGAIEISKLFQSLGADFFAVASVFEAIELLDAGINSPMLVLSPPLKEEIEYFVSHQIRVAITDLKRAELLSKEGVLQNKTVKVHVKVDTGMGRLGVPDYEAKDFIVKLSAMDNIEIEGIFSHFPSADLLDEFSFEQIKRFKELCNQLKDDYQIEIPIRHIGNSAGLAAYNQDSFFTAVRPGIILYGAAPSEIMAEDLKPKQVAYLKAPIIEIKHLKEGQTVSYGRTYKAQKDMKVAVVSIGYADGYSTLNSSKAVVYVKGKACSLLGRVCMDYLMVDVSGLDLCIGEEALLYGDEKGIRAEDIAKQTGLIPYEVLTNISQRLPRRYI